MTNKKEITGISYSTSYTMPLTNGYGFTSPTTIGPVVSSELTAVEKDTFVHNVIDALVDSMTSFPEVEKMLHNIFNK